MTIVQVTGCLVEDGQTTPFVPDEQAQFFGVYIGKPGEFKWLADFALKADAIDFAQCAALLNAWAVEIKP